MKQRGWGTERIPNPSVVFAHWPDSVWPNPGVPALRRGAGLTELCCSGVLLAVLSDQSACRAARSSVGSQRGGTFTAGISARAATGARMLIRIFDPTANGAGRQLYL